MCEEDRPNPDIVSNQWNRPGSHYECHHLECVVMGTARLYFITYPPGMSVRPQDASSSSLGHRMPLTAT